MPAPGFNSTLAAQRGSIAQHAYCAQLRAFAQLQPALDTVAQVGAFPSGQVCQLPRIISAPDMPFSIFQKVISYCSAPVRQSYLPWPHEGVICNRPQDPRKANSPRDWSLQPTAVWSQTDYIVVGEGKSKLLATYSKPGRPNTRQSACRWPL